MPGKLNIKNSFFLIAGVVLLLLSCSSSKFGLSREEKKFSDALNTHNLSFKIYHDKKAIEHNTQNGVYHVKLSGYGLCSSDSNYLKKGAAALAEKLLKVMNFKQNYRYVDIEYENITYGGPNNALGEQPVCINTVRLPVNNLSQAFIYKKLNTHDNNSGHYTYRNLAP